jgi:hypothetical protein
MSENPITLSADAALNMPIGNGDPSPLPLPAATVPAGQPTFGAVSLAVDAVGIVPVANNHPVMVSDHLPPSGFIGILIVLGVLCVLASRTRRPE